MEFLGSQNVLVGYPLIVFYIIALLGISVSIFRPYWGFLFSLFCLSARNFHAAVQTRTGAFGPYLNLNDLLLWIAVFALIIEFLKTKRRFSMPKILMLMFILIFIGDIQSLIKYGFIEEVARRIWGSSIFPILFLVGSNFVKDEKRAKAFFWTLYCGAVFAAIQHISFMRAASSVQLYREATEIRIISYISSGGLFLLVSGLLQVPSRKLVSYKLALFYGGLALIAISYIMSLTRGIYVYLFVAIPAFLFMFRGKFRLNRIMLVFIAFIASGLILARIVLPNVDMRSALVDRFSSFITRDTFSSSYKSRWLGAQTELDLWLDKTTIFLGAGSSLPPNIETADPELTGALYHVGFSTYLVHYGIFGLLLYGLFLPLFTIKISKSYFINHRDLYGGAIGLLAIASSLFDLVGLFWSQNHLFATTHVQGLIYGAIWGLYCNMCKQRNVYIPFKNIKSCLPEAKLGLNEK